LRVSIDVQHSIVSHSTQNSEPSISACPITRLTQRLFQTKPTHSSEPLSYIFIPTSSIKGNMQ